MTNRQIKKFWTHSILSRKDRPTTTADFGTTKLGGRLPDNLRKMRSYGVAGVIILCRTKYINMNAVSKRGLSNALDSSVHILMAFAIVKSPVPAAMFSANGY
jgi:hypothetical protein